MPSPQNLFKAYNQHHDLTYLEALRNIRTNGRLIKNDRTGTGTYSLHGLQMRFDMSAGRFPLLTTKKLFTRGIIEELLWILRGSTDNQELADINVHIWDEWALNEDLAEERVLTPYSRMVAYHKANPQLDFTQLTNKLNELGLEKGHEFLDEQGVPRTEKVVRYRKGELGPIYGKQWRSWMGADRQIVDQISELIDNLIKKPYSRRHVVSAWNPTELPDESISPQDNVKQGRMALAPCHCLFQFFVHPMTLPERFQAAEQKLGYPVIVAPDYEKSPNEVLDELGVPDKRLSCQLYQRSADFFLGVPFNIASYAMLTHMVASVTNMAVGEFIWTGGDCHIYLNHLDQVDEQLSRDARRSPVLVLEPANDIFSFQKENFTFKEYDPHPAIKGEVSV